MVPLRAFQVEAITTWLLTEARFTITERHRSWRLLLASTRRLSPAGHSRAGRLV